MLDTNVVLWWLGGHRRLAKAQRSTIADRANEVFVSAASVWEISIKRAIGKLTAPDDLIEQLARSSFEVVPLTAEDAWIAGSLPAHHADPFDRAIVAQTLCRDLQLLSADARLARYGVDLLRA